MCIFKQIWIPTIILAFLSACGSGEESAPPPDTSVTSNTVYGPTEGITYICSSGYVGKTAVDGSYICDEGDNVTFFLGDTEVATVDANDDITTPYDLFPGDSLAALNYVRLLQAMDSDGDQSYGAITLDPAFLADLDQINFSSPTFDSDIQPLLDKYGVQLITLDQAQNTLNTAVTQAGGNVPDGSNTPIANAGQDKDATTNIFSLDGSGSTDPDGDSLTYQWTIISKPLGSLSSLAGSDTATPTLNADTLGIYSFSLVVNDGVATSLPDTVDVNVTDGTFPPIANAGLDQLNAETNTVVNLDGSASYDPTSKGLTFSWNMNVQPVGSNIFLTSISETESFTPTVDGTYEIELKVNNGTYISSDIVIIKSKTTVPIANAGDNQNVLVNTSVTLDGSSSSDPSSLPLTYTWSVVSGPSSVTLSDINAIKPTFTPDAVGEYEISLIVNNGSKNSVADTVLITANPLGNLPPIANAGLDQTISTGSVVTLNASASSDPDNGPSPLTYLWTEPAFSDATLSNTTSPNPTFTANTDGDYVFSLIVNDGEANSTVDTVTITATTANVPPVANAGSAQNVITGDTVQLDASASSDEDGDTLSYAWSFNNKPATSTATFNNANILNPTFTTDADGDYTLQVTVSDGQGNSDSATVTVTATAPAANAVPVANAGNDQNGYENDIFTLDGTGSSDANGDTLTYNWSVKSKPSGSTVSLGNNTDTPTFSTDTAGTYIINLVVNDGTDDSVADSVTINVIKNLPTKQTGQTYSSVSGDDGSYKKGAAISYTRSGDIVIDNVTGLMWQNNNDSSSESITASQATTYCSNLSLGGYNDWRVPALRELFEIANFSKYNPSVDLTLFNNMPYPYEIWSSTLFAGSYYHLSDYSSSNIDDIISSTTWRDVRCVRGQSVTQSLQRDSNRGVVIDAQRKLVWQDNINPGNKSWSSAVSYCENLTHDGSSQWRLPNINELMSVIDFSRTTGVYNGTFTYNPSTSWSSTYQPNYNYISPDAYAIDLTSYYGYTRPKIISVYIGFTSNSKTPKCVRDLE